VRDGQNGFVVPPNPENLAEAMAALMANRDDAVRLGEQGRRDTSHLTWAATIAKLTPGLAGR
jgi:glycosyltransferase involved in cell wall biosynthesis